MTYTETMMKLEKNITFIPQFKVENDVDRFINACDLAVETIDPVRSY